MRWGGAILALCLCLTVCLLVVALRSATLDSRQRLRVYRERGDWVRAHADALQAARLRATTREELEKRYRELTGMQGERHAEEQ